MVEKTSSSEDTKPLERIPRIARYMALAIHFEGLIRQGVVADFADLARLGHVTRARVTQIMNLRLLAPEIQEDVLFQAGKHEKRDRLGLKELQQVAMHPSWSMQREVWFSLNRKIL
jgi:hypothetical protein